MLLIWEHEEKYFNIINPVNTIVSLKKHLTKGKPIGGY
jgi:hypothetical protein